MPGTLSNPDGVTTIPLYHQVSVATGSRLVSVAGQVATDASGETVGVGDVAAQTEQCYLNVATALASVGAGMADVVRLTVYVVGIDDTTVGLLGRGMAAAEARLGLDESSRPPLTGIGVAALAGPDLLVELEATAVLA